MSEPLTKRRADTPKGSNGGSWNDERVAVLRKLWTAGMSASQIAKQLGGVSRNGVIGKAHRLGLVWQGPSAPATRQNRFRAPTGAKLNTAQPRIIIAGKNQVRVCDPLPPKDPLPQGTADEPALCPSVEALEAHMCKWPVGRPLDEFMGFCGRDRAGEGPYCREHTKRAYAPPKPGAPRTGNELARSLRRYA